MAATNKCSNFGSEWSSLPFRVMEITSSVTKNFKEMINQGKDI